MSAPPTTGLWRERLPNGVTLLVQRRRNAPAVSLVSHIRAGFLDEPDNLVGVSHVLEHMLFKGTPSVGPGELAQRTKALGGSVNAYTSYDRTVYYASVPARNIAELVVLQADQVQHASLDADELRRELGVIIQEARRKLDSPGAVAGETLHQLLFDSHRLRRWRIGTEPMLEAFTRDDVAGYYTSRYVPARVIVSLVGDVDEAEAMAMLRANWGAWTGPEVEIPAGPVETSVATVRARRLDGDVALGEIVLGWRAPGTLDADVPALEIASAILGLGRGSRLSRALREPGLVNALGVGSYGAIDAGVFAISVELDPARTPEVLGVIGSAVAELASSVAGSAEYDRALTMLRARIGRHLERHESRAIALAEAEALGDVTRLDREESDLLAVTPAAVRDVARRWLVPGGVSAVAYLPRASEAPFDAELLRRTVTDSLAASAPPDVLPAAPTSAGTPSSRPERGAPRLAAPLSSRSVVHRALDGVDVLAARFGETGQVSIALYRPRNLLETPATAGLGTLAVRSMVRGTARHDASALAVAIESLGGSLSPTLGADLIGFGTTVLSEHVRAAAGILTEVLRQPRLDPATIAVERGLLLDDARAVADDMLRFPVQLALGVGFGDTGYGSPAFGTAESLESFDTARVRGWHETMLRGGRTTVVAVGDADPGWLADEIARTMPGEASDGSPFRRSFDSLGMTAFTPGFRSDARDRKQSALAMLFPGPSRHDPARFAAETWGAIAAGLGGRLFESLRSKRSLAYTVIATSWQRARAGGLLTYIATDPARLDEARAAMLEELELFRREPPSDAELSRAKAMLVGQVEMSRQTAGEVAGEIADAWLLGEGLGDLDDPALPYRAVTAEDVHAVAATSLDPASRAEGVIAAIATE